METVTTEQGNKLIAVAISILFFLSPVKAQFGIIDTVPPTPDTIKVLMLVSDTSFKNGIAWHEWGYEVRDKYCCINGNTGSLAYFQAVPYYTHNHYLNDKKRRFKNTIVVWMSRSN